MDTKRRINTIQKQKITYNADIYIYSTCLSVMYISTMCLYDLVFMVWTMWIIVVVQNWISFWRILIKCRSPFFYLTWPSELLINKWNNPPSVFGSIRYHFKTIKMRTWSWPANNVEHCLTLFFTVGFCFQQDNVNASFIIKACILIFDRWC